MELRDKVALITGGGTGLGREIALIVAGEGCHVALNYLVSEKESEATAADCRMAGVKAITVQGDVSISADVARVVEHTMQHFGRIDILFANAGTTAFVPMADMEGMKEEDWERIMDVNVKGTWLCAKAVAPHMKSQKSGHIVITSSTAGLKPSGSCMAYSVSKAAEVMLTRCLALALAPEILVNSVAPGLMATRWGLRFGEETVIKWGKSVPLGRVPTVTDVAAAAVFLAKNDSVTGQAIPIESGFLL